jgi:hypothetical protein
MEQRGNDTALRDAPKDRIAQGADLPPVYEYHAKKGRGRRGRVCSRQRRRPRVDDYGSTEETLHSLSKILLYLYGVIVAGVPFISALIPVGVLIREFFLIWIFFSRLSNMTLPTIWGLCLMPMVQVSLAAGVVGISALVALYVLNPNVQFIVHTLSCNAGYWMSPIVQYIYCKMRRNVIIVIGSVYHGDFGWFYLLIIQLCFAAGDVGMSALVALCGLGQFVQYTYRGMCQILGRVIIRTVRLTFTSSSRIVKHRSRVLGNVLHFCIHPINLCSGYRCNCCCGYQLC